MRTLLVMVVVMVSACGQGVQYAPDPVDTTQAMTARIENDYAESLFTMTVNVSSGPDGGVRSIRLFDDVRIAGYRSASKDFSAKPGDRVTFDLSAMSLGQRYTFSNVEKLGPVEASKDVLEVTYDYDLATADFVISYRWAAY